jgi:hypothetical protein
MKVIIFENEEIKMDGKSRAPQMARRQRRIREQRADKVKCRHGKLVMAEILHHIT